MGEETIYVRLTGDGLDRWKPVQARPTGGEGIFLILDQDRDQDRENWEFQPGQQVLTEEGVENGETVRRAFRRA